MDPVKIKCIAICRETTICVLSCVKKMLNFPKSSLLVHAQRLSHCFNIITTKCSWLRCHLCVRYSLTSCDMRATLHQIFFLFFFAWEEKLSWWRKWFPDISATCCILKNFSPPFRHFTLSSITLRLWRLSRGAHWHAELQIQSGHNRNGFLLLSTRHIEQYPPV